MLVLEQFLILLPDEVKTRMRGQCLESGAEAVAVVKDWERVKNKFF